MQLHVIIKDSLSDYYQKVKKENKNILSLIILVLDFKSCCPICRETNCAESKGHYTRIVIDEKARCYSDFPIARFLCVSIKKSFSLLPYQLVPYCKYSIELILIICNLSFVLGWSVTQVLDYLADLNNDEPLYTSASQIQRLKKLIIGAIDKIFSTRYYPDFEAKALDENKKGQGKYFIKFAEGFECVKVSSFTIKGGYGLGHDFYLNGGGYLQNASFLFGVAYQFRHRGS